MKIVKKFISKVIALLRSEISNICTLQCCNIVTEERAVTRLRHSKQLTTVTTIAHVTEGRIFLWCPRGWRHPTIEELLEALLSVRSVPSLYNEDQLSLRENLETVVRRVCGWCEVAASLLGRAHGSRGTYTVLKRYPAARNDCDWEH
jgi:hypothetical protein